MSKELKYAELIGKLTLEEKASLTSGKDFWQSMDIKRDDIDIPNMFLADGPHGIRRQVAAADHLGLNPSANATCFPTAVTMANSWNDELGEQMAQCLGKEAVSQDVNVLLGPGTNMKRNPRCGRNFEYFSEDPFLAGKMASAYARGIQSNGISACVKHFAANNQEESRMTMDSVMDERTLREIYLPAFEMAVKEGGVRTIMSAYNLINGEYANESMHLLKEILRDDWGFKGVIVTDWGGDNDRVEGLKAGNELEMPTTGGETNQDIIKAVKEHPELESVLDECVDRLLELIFTTTDALKKSKESLGEDAERAKALHEEMVKEHHEMAVKAAEEAMVLLKNEDGTLPLKDGQKVAIVGDFAATPRYQGAGSSLVNPTRLDKTLDIVKDYGFEYIGYEKGFDRYGKKNGGLIKKAVKLAGKADVVLAYIGLDEITESEGLDRSNIKLPQNQIDLLAALKATGKKVVAVLSCGSAVEVTFDDSCDAVLYAALSGQGGARAVMNVLTGKTTPSGKLSESYPIKYEDCSSASHFPGVYRTVEYREGLYIGYRYYDTANVPVKYPFGFGLSYTTFEYSDIKVDKSGVTFKLKNTGSVTGKEVAQMYIGKKDAEVFRPKKELKGFKKVELAPGEEKQVTIPFDEYTFRYFNVSTNKWEIEGGDYEVYVAASVEDVRLEGSVTVEGTGAKNPYVKEALASYYSGNVADVSDSEFETLIARPIPDPKKGLNFYKKKRIHVDYNTTVKELKYSRRWVGRLFAGAINFAIGFMRGIGKRTMANTLIMGVLNQPMRGLSRMTGGAINFPQLDGLIEMFNGHFWKGLHHFLKAGRARKKEAKLKKKAEKQAAKQAAKQA